LLRKREIRAAARSRLLALGAAGAIALAGAGTAAAASPQQIYRDLADNGVLDGRYKPAEIRRALDLGQVVQTDRRTPASPRQRTPLPEVRIAPATEAVPQPQRSGRRLPLTGLDLAFFMVGVGPMLLIGVGLRRRLSAPRPERAGVVRT
jgi:hypothetical protein